MSWAWLSLLTNVTWLPRGTVTFLGLTALFAIVIVEALVPPPPGDGAGDGEDGVAGHAAPPLEPPPHAMTVSTVTSMPARAIRPRLGFASPCDRPARTA